MADHAHKLPAARSEYDPHDHRSNKNPTHSCNNWHAMAHVLKGSIGTGVFGMPYAFANSGYINGLILTIIIALIVVYSVHILIGSMYKLCKRKRIPYLSYADSMTTGFEEGPSIFRCFIPIGNAFIDGFLAFYQFGICCTYVVFIAESSKQVADEYYEVMPVRMHMWFILLPIVLICCITNLKILAYFTTLANVLLLVGFGIILYYLFQDLPPLTEREAVVHISKWPMLFGIVLFSIASIGVFLAVEENMETPKDYLKPLGIINVAMTMVTILYIGLGFFGYWKYGKETRGSVTLNIPQKEVLSQVTQVIFAITIWITYALQCYVTISIVWYKYIAIRIEDESKHYFYELLFRTFLAILSILISLIVPSLGLIVALVGAFCLSILVIIFPAILEICVLYATGYGPCKIHLIKDIFLLLFGMFGGAVGTYVSVVEIVNTLY